MAISRKAKEAIKTALAMTLAYGIALSMGWDKPMWAGLAVAFTSLATIGQSFNKAAMRTFGTFVAAFVGLMLIAFFAQDRWLFMLSLSSWVGFCTYMMGGTKRNYFWNVCGMVCVIICMDAGSDSANAFKIAALRVQQTALGILVYSLVAILLWPKSSRTAFEAAASKLASAQRELYKSILQLANGQENAAGVQASSAAATQAQSSFNQLLGAAETDSYQVRQKRHIWRRYQRQMTQVSEAMEHLRDSLADLEALDLAAALPNLATVGEEIDARLASIELAASGKSPGRRPATIDLTLDAEAAERLTHFEKAALAVALSHLQNLEHLTRSPFDMDLPVESLATAGEDVDKSAMLHFGFVPDPDRMTAVIRVIVTMWLAYFTLVYVADVPGGPTLVTMSGVFGMILGTVPQMPVSKLAVPVAGGAILGSVLYIFIMPRLASFAGLGLLIFVSTFFFCYVFAAPHQALGRAFGLALFAIISGISNEQTYSLFSITTTALAFALCFLILAVTAYIPFSPRPERAFQRLLKRFFRSCDRVTTAARWDTQRAETAWEQRKMAFHVREVSTLPAKLAAWGRFIDPKALPGTSPEQVQVLVANLQTLSRRIQTLLQERDDQQAGILARASRADTGAWHLGVQEGFRLLSSDPSAARAESFRTRLDEIMRRLEDNIRSTMGDAAADKHTDEEFYRLLGACRSVSESMVDYAASASIIGWDRWKEERFA
jgi:uncharacterized membrane protein YgaE (UPF0421/DUF939 family)